MLEVDEDLDPLVEQRAQTARPFCQRGLVVRRLPQPEIAEGRIALQRADERIAFEIDVLPGVVPELERVPQLGVERVEEEAQQALVARPGRR